MVVIEAIRNSFASTKATHVGECATKKGVFHKKKSKE
jgi:hypothetical protein